MTVIELWKEGSISQAELISYLGTHPEESVDELQDPALQAKVDNFRQAVADGVPLILIQSHCEDKFAGVAQW